MGLGLLGQGYLTQGSNPLGPRGNSLFFSESRLKSTSFEPLIGFLAFVVGKL